MSDISESSASNLMSESSLRFHSPVLRRRRFDDRSQTAISVLLEQNSSAAHNLDLLHLRPNYPSPGVSNNLVRWNFAKSIETIINSVDFVQSFGKPRNIDLSPLHIAVGTTEGVVVGFNYHQEMIFALSLHSIDASLISLAGTSVSCISFSSDSTFLAAGFVNGTVALWDLNKVKPKPGNYSVIFPYGIISPVTLKERFVHNSQGHLKGITVNNVLFIGGSNNQVISSDTSGLVFYHHGFVKFTRKYHTTQKILGKNDTSQSEPTGKFRIRACQVLPIGSFPQITDRIGLLAVMTTKILAIVSVCSLNDSSSINPITHLKLSLSKQVYIKPGSIPLGCLSWYPCIRHRGEICNAKLAYAWNNVVSIIELDNKGLPENLPDVLSELKDKDRGIPNLSLTGKARWMTPQKEDIVSELKWLNSEILTALVKNPSSTETKLFFLYYASTENGSKLIEVGKDNLDSQQIAWSKLATGSEQDYETTYQGSIQVFRHTLMILTNSHSTSGKSILVGKTLKWADNLMECLKKRNFYGSLLNACEFYSSENHGKLVLSGLPHTRNERHEVVRPFLLQIMEECVLPLFQNKSGNIEPDEILLLYLQIIAMLSKETKGVAAERSLKILELIEEAYLDKQAFYLLLEKFILSRQIHNISPTIFKKLVDHYVESEEGEKLTGIICVLDPSTLSIDMTLKLCLKYDLRACSVYIWNRILHDYKSPFITLIQDLKSPKYNHEEKLLVYAYMSYVLSGRQFPSDEHIVTADEHLAQLEICDVLLSIDTYILPENRDESDEDTLFPQLFFLLKFDTFEMFLTLNEFYENPCLNTEEGVGLNRQYIMDALFDVFDMSEESFNEDDLTYFAIFVARNYPKYSQFIRISGSRLESAIELLCSNENDNLHQDCELALESLLPFHDLPSNTLLYEKLHAAKFHDVLFGLYRSQGNLSKALEIWLEKQSSIKFISPGREQNFTVISDIIRNTFESPSDNSDEKSQLKDFLTRHFEELVDHNMEDMIVLANMYDTDFHLAVLNCTNELLAFQYLRALFQKFDISMSAQTKALLAVKYIELSALHDIKNISGILRKLLPILKNQRNIKSNLERFLKEKHLLDTLAILLNLDGRTQQALEEILKAVEEIITHSGSQSNLQDHLDVAIGISEGAKDEKVWKYFVRKLISLTNLSSGEVLEILNQGIYNCFRKMIESRGESGSHQAFARVFNDMLEIATLGNVRLILHDVLLSFFFDTETQKITLSKVNREILKHMTKMKIEKIGGLSVSNKRCTSCDKPMCGPGVSADSYQAWEDKMRERTFYTLATNYEMYEHLSLILFNCGHGYHLQCLKGLGGSDFCVMCTLN